MMSRAIFRQVFARRHDAVAFTPPFSAFLDFDYAFIDYFDIDTTPMLLITTPFRMPPVTPLS
jgi:hypothetical protein